MDRTYDEILENLEENADYELVVSTARRSDEYGDEVYLALVTVDGVTRGVVTRDSTLDALELAAERAITPEPEFEDDYDDLDDLDDSEEDVFDRAVGALETAVELLRRVRR